MAWEGTILYRLLKTVQYRSYVYIIIPTLHCHFFRNWRQKVGKGDCEISLTVPSRIKFLTLISLILSIRVWYRVVAYSIESYLSRDLSQIKDILIMDPSSNVVVEGLVPVYRGNTMSGAERSRFDFPERTYEGQPVGVRLSGTQSQHQHDIMSRDEPSYTYSPTQQEIAVSPIAMPKIKNVSPQSKPTEMMGIRRDQDN